MLSHPLPLSTLWVALHAWLLLALAVLVIRQRARCRVVFGDGKGAAPALEQAMRVHGNAVEFVPVSLIVLVLAELAGLPGLWVHLAGGSLLLARVLHAWGLSKATGTSAGRAAGAMLQFTWLIVVPGWLVLRVAGLA